MKVAALALISVLSSHYGDWRNSSNARESVLNPTNVAGLQSLGNYSVDGAVFAQPLVVEDIQTSAGYRDLLIVCTLNDSCYAFDANQPGSAAIWRVTLGTPLATYPGGAAVYYGLPMGCISTPAIDPYAQILYVVCSTTGPQWVLNQISLSTGSVITSAVISGQVPGSGMTGDTIVAGQLQFSPYYALQKAGLALSNGNVYVAFSSHDDFSVGSWHGWLFAYSTANLSQVGIFCTTPNGAGGSIWQSGGAPAVDPNGNIYALSGNGDYDGATNWANSLLKFSPSLALVDWFTPSNYAAISAADYDLSSSRPILVPGAGLVAFSFKGAVVYSTPLSCLGHLQGSGSCALQTLANMVIFAGHDNGVYSGVAYQNGTAYFAPVGGPIFPFTLAGSTWTAGTQGATNYPFPGATMTVSSQSGANAILWAAISGGPAETMSQQGTLYALNPATFATLWSGATGTLAKFVPPIVANGRVYVATLDGVVEVYGLKPAAPHVTLRTGTLRGTATLR